jgi:predicted cobalt transporter CbtA
MSRHSILKFVLMFAFSNLTGYCFAVAAAPNIPGVEPVWEKGTVWGLVGFLMWWILGKLSKQLDGLTAAVEKLADRIAKGG